MSKKVWLVTGCSKGLGKALVEELIAQGYPVAGTSRSKESLEKSIGAESDLFLPPAELPAARVTASAGSSPAPRAAARPVQAAGGGCS